MKESNLINIGLVAALLAGCTRSGIRTPDPHSPIITPTPITETYTPFQPETFVPFNSTETAIPSPTPEISIPYKMFGIDFADSGKKIDIKIALSTGKNFDIDSTPTVCEDTSPYSSLFLPGEHFTCEYQFRNNPEDMGHYTHSGWFHEPMENGGINYVKLEAENIRHYFEDATNYDDDKKRLTLAQIQERMTEFVNANVSISQGDITTEGLKVLNIVRVPPDKLGPFIDFCPNIGASQSHVPEGMKLNAAGECVGTPTGQIEQLTNEDVMATLALIDPSFTEYVSDGKPQIIIIFCGWRSPEDNPIKDSTPGFYEWSRYVIILGK